MDKKDKRIPMMVIMLGFVSLFTDASSEMIYPLIPVFVQLLGGGAIVLGVIEGVAETTAAMLKLASGIISDKIGKQKLLVLVGYAISTVVRPITGVVSTAWEIVLIRMFDRVGKGIRTSPRDALIASTVDESIRGKSYGFHRAMDNTGAVIGPILAITTLLILFMTAGIHKPLSALRWTFILSIIPGFLAVLTIIFFVRESKKTGKSANKFKFSLAGFDRNFKNYLLVVLLFTLGNSSDMFLLFRVEEGIQKNGAVTGIVNGIGFLREMLSHFGDTAVRDQIVNILFLPLVWSFFHIIKVAFGTALGALSDRIGRKIVINIGWGIYAFVYFSFAILVFLPSGLQLIATFILFAVYAFFYAFTEGAERAFVADIVPEGMRGSAFGLYNFTVGLAALPASVIFGFLYSLFNKIYPGFGGTVAFGFGGFLALLSMVLLVTLVREKEVRKF